MSEEKRKRIEQDIRNHTGWIPGKHWGTQMEERQAFLLEELDRVTAERDEAGKEMLISAGLVTQMTSNMARLKAERDAAIQRAEKAEAVIASLKQGGYPGDVDAWQSALEQIGRLNAALEQVRVLRARLDRIAWLVRDQSYKAPEQGTLDGFMREVAALAESTSPDVAE